MLPRSRSHLGSREDQTIRLRVFLSGSMQTKEDWRAVARNGLDPTYFETIEIWEHPNGGGVQDQALIERGIEWELDQLEKCDLVLVYFHPNTQAPITLFEFGLVALRKKSIVCCPPSFWKAQYITAACRFLNISLFSNLGEGICSLNSLARKSRW